MTYVIMHVEDSPLQHESLVDQIKENVDNENGDNKTLIVHAENGEEAIKKFKEQIYNLLILDLHIPMKIGGDAIEGGGLETERKLKNTESYKLNPCKILYLSGDKESLTQATGAVKAGGIIEEDIFDKNISGYKLITARIKNYIDEPESLEQEEIMHEYEKEIKVLLENNGKTIATEFIKCAVVLEKDVELLTGELYQKLYGLTESLINFIAENYFFPTKTLFIDDFDRKYCVFNKNRDGDPTEVLNINYYLMYLFKEKKAFDMQEYYLIRTTYLNLNILKHKRYESYDDPQFSINMAKSNYYSILVLLQKIASYDEYEKELGLDDPEDEIPADDEFGGEENEIREEGDVGKNN